MLHCSRLYDLVFAVKEEKWQRNWCGALYEKIRYHLFLYQYRNGSQCAPAKVHGKYSLLQVHESHGHIQGVMNTSYHLCDIIRLFLSCIRSVIYLCFACFSFAYLRGIIELCEYSGNVLDPWLSARMITDGILRQSDRMKTSWHMKHK